MTDWRYLNSPQGVKSYATTDPIRKWTDMEAPKTASEREEEELWKMSDAEYENFLHNRRRRRA